MASQPRRDTAPELAVRRILHSAGLRYRVDYRPLADRRRTVDIAFPARRVAVFIDGCFWHSCPEHATFPKANEAWWAAKLQRNVERDRETDERLGCDGWLVLRFWEHEAPDEVASQVEGVVRSRSPIRRSTPRAR